MKLVELTEEGFYSFSKNHEYLTFMQTTKMAEIRKKSGWTINYIGLKDKDKVVAATILSSKKIFLNKRFFYSPRGFLINFNDFELLKDFTNKIKKYIKDNNGFYLKIDPYVIYKYYDEEGKEKKDCPNNEQIINNLKRLKFKHYGFTKHFDKNVQVRWMYRLNLKDSIEKIRFNYYKSTRKNIEHAKDKGVVIKVATKKDLKEVYKLLNKTAERKGFNNRNLSYYEMLFDTFKEDIKIYLAVIDRKLFYKNSIEFFKKEKINNDNINYKIKTEKVGNKLRNNKIISDKLLKKYESYIKEAEKLKEDVLMGALIAIKSGDEYIALSSGIDNNYVSFNPKYLLYDKYIEDGKKEKFKFANFYGITGDFNKNSKDYGIYEFKKGFQGEIVELIGEFDLVINKLYYYAYKVLFKIYNLYKKLRLKLRK